MRTHHGGALSIALAVTLSACTPNPGGVPSPEPTTPSSDAEVADLLNGFLDARVAGAGAYRYLAVSVEDVPLLYATTSGAPYERAEFEPVRGIEWPYSWLAFKVRMFAADTVVEQLFFIGPDRQGLEYQRDGFATEIAPTTEGGQPVADTYHFGVDVTLRASHPWIMSRSGQYLLGRLIPEGPEVRPTTDGGERVDWDELVLMADPAVVTKGCQPGPSLADAASLAETIRSYPGLEATAPTMVAAGAGEALMMDVVIPAGTTITVPTDELGNLCPHAILHPLFDQNATIYFATGQATGQATGEQMRLYLIDAPEGLSIRTLAIAIIAPESRSERAVEAAGPVVDSVEFHGP